MFTLKKREDKKGKAASVTRSCFLFYVIGALDGSWFHGSKEGCHNSRQHSRLAVSALHPN